LKKIIFISPVTYFPDYSGNSSRVKQLMSAFYDASDNVEIHFVLCPFKKFESGYTGEFPDDIINKIVLNEGKAYKLTWRQYLLEHFRWNINKYFRLSFDWLNDYMFKDGLVCNKAVRDVTQVIDRIQPDIVVVEYAVLSKLLVNLPSNIVKVVDTHDKFSNRNKKIRLSGGLGFWMSLSEKQEATLLKRFNYVIAIQDNERNFFKSILINKNTLVITISITRKAFDREIVVNKQDNGDFIMGFIGSNNKHNKEGLEYFIQKHWLPIISKIDNVKLVIAGTVKVDEKYLAENTIQHLGKVESLTDFYSTCSFIINPCLSGTGLKIKSVEALEFGKVLVTTLEGAEGLASIENCGAFIHDLKDISFANRCIELCVDNTRLKSLEHKNMTYINERYQDSLNEIKYILTGI